MQAPALHHKILANYYGRLADNHSDAGEGTQAAYYYQLEAYHSAQREAHGGHLGGRQLDFPAAAAYAAKYAA